jgi:hypothetical protein
MKLREETPDRLVLEDRPVVLGVVLALAILGHCAGGLFVAQDDGWTGLGIAAGAMIWGLAFWAFVRRTIVILDRPSGMALRRVASVTGQSEEALPLERVTGAIVQSRRSLGKNPSTTYRAALVVRGDEPFALTQAFSSGEGARNAAAAVNRWLPGAAAG